MTLVLGAVTQLIARFPYRLRIEVVGVAERAKKHSLIAERTRLTSRDERWPLSVAVLNTTAFSPTAREQLRTRALDPLGCTGGVLEGEPVRVIRWNTVEFGREGMCERSAVRFRLAAHLFTTVVLSGIRSSMISPSRSLSIRVWTEFWQGMAMANVVVMLRHRSLPLSGCHEFLKDLLTLSSPFLTAF